MEVLRKQIRRAQRRLAVQRFVGVLTWCWFGTLLVAAVAIGIDKYRSLGVDPRLWVPAALGLGLLVAGVWSWVTRHGALEAALEIDRRFGLKERVSSTFSLEPEQLDSPAGKALLEDALKRVERLQVAEQFRVRPNRWVWVPLLPAAAAFLLATFLHPAVGENPAEGTTKFAVKKAVKSSSEQLRKKLIDRRKEARERGLKDAEELFKKLEQGTKDLAKSDLADRKQAMVQLNDLAKDLEKRREQLGNSEKLQEQLKNLKDIARGPGDQLADAMRQGDFKQALEEAKHLKEKIEKGQLNEKERQELAKQLDQMQKKLRQMADAHQKLQDDLKKQLAEAKSKGRKKQAEELQKQLDQLAQKNQQMKQMKQMAEKLGQCSKCMKQGDQAGAKAALEDIQNQLADLKEQLDELAMLDEAMDEMNQAKDAMNCPDCNGMGCEHCMGKRPGRGRTGRGRGIGDRDEEEGKTNFYDTKVKQKLGKGGAVVAGFVEGPNKKGEIEQEVATQFEAAKADREDPLTNQNLPRSYREHAQKYFDNFREGANKK